jgi:transposase
MKSIKFVPELAEQEIANLKTLENGDWPGRVRKRAEAILLSGRGYTIDQIGAITGFHRNTVSRWLDQWSERGIDGILEREGRGRKHSLSEEEERQVVEWIEENPRSANQAVGRIEESLGKIVSPDTVRRLLKRKGKVWKRV